MEKGQADRRPSDTDSQDSGPASDFSEGQPVEQLVDWPVTPAASAAIPMEALLAITQALKLSNTGNRTEIRLPNLSLFLKQFEDVADANG